jgi:hypothetical protein
LGTLLSTLAAVAVSASAAARPAAGLPSRLPPDGFEPRKGPPALELSGDDAGRLRREVLARALLWPQPASRVRSADLAGNGPDRPWRGDELACKFRPSRSSGSTPKFECVLRDGEVVKVKYGANPEIHTELAATRLLRALGAGADRVFLARRVRCFGCPEEPFALVRCVSSLFEPVRRQCIPLYGALHDTGRVVVRVDYSRYRDFRLVAVERGPAARSIELDGEDGWGFGELGELPATRRSGRAERDALRLLAVLLQNWDTRPDNQRLLCLDADAGRGGGCATPLAYMHDVGATFGRADGARSARKLDVEAWASAPLWADETGCRAAISPPRFHGATLGEATISERGRAFLADRLRRLSRGQIRALFEGARFPDYEGASPASRDVARWAEAFEDKVRQVVDRGPCPEP